MRGRQQTSVTKTYFHRRFTVQSTHGGFKSFLFDTISPREAQTYCTSTEQLILKCPLQRHMGIYLTKIPRLQQSYNN